jgi:hypothetical protein
LPTNASYANLLSQNNFKLVTTMPSFLKLQTSACDGLSIKTACGRNFAAWKNQLVVLAKQLSVGVLTRQWSIFDNKLVLTVTEAPQHST